MTDTVTQKREKKEKKTDMMTVSREYALRKCSFDPEEHLINLETDPHRRPRLYLTVEWRVYWFQTWCRENDKRYLIEEEPVEAVPGTGFVQSRCTVYIDGEPAGFGVGGINLNGSRGGDYCIQSCATIAKGRALANAGFGSVLASALDSENGADIPCDGGMGTEFFHLTADKEEQENEKTPDCTTEPADAGTEPERKKTAVPERVKQAERPEAPREISGCPETREEALNFPVPLRGEWFQKPLGEVFAKDPGAVRWFAEKSRSAALKKAAGLLMNPDLQGENR